MTKPWRATLIAGASACASVIVPWWLQRRSQPSTVPGTPTDMPLKRASLNGSGAPFSKNDVGVHRLRRALAMVERRDPLLRGVVGDHEAAAADAAGERLGDAEHGRRRDRRVGRVAAAAQRVDRGLRREPVDGRGGAAVAGRGRRAGGLGRGGSRGEVRR